MMSEEDNYLPEEDSPTHPSYMKELALAKADEMADYWNQRHNDNFINNVIPNWVKEVVDNGEEMGLPFSPPILMGVASKELFGWQPSVEPIQPRYTREDTLLMLDASFQEQNNTDKSLWSVVPNAVLILVGIEVPETPSDFGKAVGPHLPGCFFLGAAAGYVPQGTVRKVDGVSYMLTGGFLKYWKPIND
jgi:hypothetical protein